MICQHLGARHIVVTDVNDYRLNLLAGEPRIKTVNVKREKLEDMISSLRMKEGFDVLYEMSGNQSAFNDLIEYSRYGAHIINLGIFQEEAKIDINKMIFKSLTFHGIYGREMYDSWYKMVSFIESGLNIKKLITHTFPYTEYEEGFKLLNNGAACKVILDWS